MAAISSNPRADYIVHSAALRNLPSEFIGNAHWDYALQNDRLKLFLFRNMTRVKASHRKRCAKLAQQPAKSGQLRVHAQTQTQAQTTSTKSTNGISEVDGIISNGTTQINGIGKTVMPEHIDEIIAEHDTSIPASEAMSNQALIIKHKSDNYDSNTRKSVRTILQKQHEDPNASLLISMSNIRKRLNWKETRTSQDMPPRKKPRLEAIECDVHLAIWDNSSLNTSRLPIVSKREFGELIKLKRDHDPVKGDYVEIKLADPFIVSQRELRVPIKNGKDRTGLSKEYFLEIKITPRDEKVAWPPIPMLGKSDGERFNGMGTDAANEINTCLIARYQHLPNAPESDTPLPVFVYAEGRTFRTKYGLELNSKWLRKDHPDLIRKSTPEPDLEPWALDDGRKPFGRPDPNRKPISHAARKTAPSRRSTLKILKVPKITYKIQVSKGTKKGFNQCSVSGLKCYSCSGKSFTSLAELRFHLDQSHKNRVTIEIEVIDPTDSRLTAATIRLETATNLQPKVIHGEQEEEIDKNFTQVTPKAPFDLDAHYTGKDSPWKGLLPTQPSKEAPKPALVPAADSQSKIRRENKGHVPYQQVLPFRPQEYQRKKFPNKKLLTQHVSLQNPYTSISHRPIDLYDNEDDALSETDDEVDDGWFVDRHLEELDIHSWRSDWSDARRRLAKRWDYHILQRERGIGARYLGDCLIRFVRIEKLWILREQPRFPVKAPSMAAGSERTSCVVALMEMMEELKTMRLINENVCLDVATMLFSVDIEDDFEIPIEEQREIEAMENDVVKRSEDLLRHKSFRGRGTSESPVPETGKLPLNVCAKCRSLIGHNNTRAVRCSNLKCSTPNVWYHAKCARLPIVDPNPMGDIDSTQSAVVSDFMKTRLAWKCNNCTDATGKERLIPIVPTMARRDIPMESEEPTVQVSSDGEEESKDIAEDVVSRSTSSSMAPLSLSNQSHSVPVRDVQVSLQSQRVVYTAYVDNRKCLRGIVLNHYHEQDDCIYAIIDERPTRSRSKKVHTVLAVVQEKKSTPGLSGKRYFVQFPDATSKKNSERWWFLRRSLESEILARFRPYKIQHFVNAADCQTEPCSCVLQAPNLVDGGCLQLDTHRVNDCKYGSGTQEKEPGRGFYWNEENHGSVWYGDYFEELQKISETEQKITCRESSHLRCTHSITAKGSRYKGFVKVDWEPWRE